MIPVLVAMPFYRMTEVDWSSSSDFVYCVAYYLPTSIVQGYPSEQIALLKRQKVDGGPVVIIMVPVVDLNWLLGVLRKMFSELQSDHRRYRGIVDADSEQPADVRAKTVHFLDDLFVLDEL